MRAQLFHLVGLALLVASCAHSPVKTKPGAEAQPNFDRRRDRPATSATAQRERAAIAARFKETIPGLRIDLDERSNAPKFVRSFNRTLSAPEPSSDNAAMLPIGAPTLERTKVDRSNRQWALHQFLNQNKEALGYDTKVLSAAKVARDSVLPRTGLRTIVWQQELKGIPVFEGRLTANLDRQGSLISLSSGLVQDLTRIGTNPTVRIPAPHAVALAARHIGEKNVIANDFATGESPQGNEQRQKFSGKAIIGDAQVSLVWLPTERSSLRLCWRVVLMGKQSGKLYQILIDANTGELWLRHCWSGSAIPLPGQVATYLVFNQDSAAPLLPGWSTPITNQPPVAGQAQLTLMAVSPTASPSGWVMTSSNSFGLTNTSFGNNVDAHLNWTNGFAAYGAAVHPPRPMGLATNNQVQFVGSAFTANLSQAVTNVPNRNAAVINAFYWCNWMHDVLYDLGFDEDAGNFQYDNYDRGTNAVAGDPVRMHVQTGVAFGLRGGGIFAASPIDGNPAQIWITLMGDATPDRDGVFDATLLLHEYTHLLSTRLVGNGAGISAHQTLALAEGWSDFYSLALLAEGEDDLNGVYPFMGYGSYHWRKPEFEQNYYFGLRAYPYSTDMSKNPLTFGLLQADPAVVPYPGVPINPFYDPASSLFAALPLNEAHALGQVWAQVLWDARANLIQKHGFTNGNWLMLQLVTDGMKLGPANPTFLEARDAVLLADQVRTGGKNSFELWAAFARRGMGYNATNAPSDFQDLDQLVPVRESFSIPPFVEITNAIHASPAIGADGTVYVGSTNGRLYAINNGSTNEFSGKIKWSFGSLTTNQAFNSSPAIDPSGVIYAGSSDSNLYAIASSGAMIWRTNLGGQIFSSPAIASDGTVYVGSGNGKLYAINPNGTVKWSTLSTGSNILSSPAVALNGTIYVGSMQPSSNLYAFNRTNGSVLPGWPVTVTNGIRSSPAIDSDGNVYVGGLDGKVYAFTTNGSPKSGWPVTTGGAIWSSPAIGSNGVVYIGSTDSNVYALNPNATTNWTYKTRGAVKSSPALGRDDTGFVGSDDSNLHVINADGTGRWQYPLGSPVFSSPVIGPDGGLLVGSTAGNLYYLPTGTPFADGPWTMFRQNFRHTANTKTLILRTPQATNGTLSVEISGPVGAQCDIEVTSDLASWSLLNSLVLTNGVGQIEISPTESHQFYRAKFSP